MPAKTVFRTTDDAFLQQRGDEIEAILQVVLASQAAWRCNFARMCSFCSVSLFSFCPALGRKGHEGFLRKQDGGRLLGSNLFSAESLPIARHFMWKTQWVALKDCAIVCSDSPQGPARSVMPVDHTLLVSADRKLNILVSSSDRQMRLAAENEDELFRWIRGFATMYPGRVGLDRGLLRYSTKLFARTGCDVRPDSLVGTRGAMGSISGMSFGVRRVIMPRNRQLLSRLPIDERSYASSRLWKPKQMPSHSSTSDRHPLKVLERTWNDPHRDG